MNGFPRTRSAEGGGYVLGELRLTDMSEAWISGQPTSRTREPLPSILRRALRLLAQADGILNGRGQISTHRRTRP
ncbi:hypothetical protein ACIQPQ_31425 [Streptomyces sp. NPDC091281]|uniref:hypothetical protein n=1 Tax=Streptomyces sp. NPDC091281 TaxID=3365985 RepID=UPI003812FD82